MSFDLYLWPIDAPITYVDASKHLEWLLEEAPDSPPSEAAVSFMKSMQTLFPDGFASDDETSAAWPPARDAVVFEMHDQAGSVFLGIPYSMVARVGFAASSLAEELGLIILDPQSEAVYLPIRFGGETVDWGTDPAAEDLAAQEAEWMAESMASVDPSVGGFVDEATAHVELLRDVQASGGSMWSPAGFELTETTMLEMLEDPNRTPRSLQTHEHKAELIADLSSRKRSERSIALAQLSGWDPDTDVVTALRPLLASEDSFIRSMAASAMARQGTTEALNDVLEVVRLASPSAGGSPGGMLVPARDALTLATLKGPDEVVRVKRLMTDWLGDTPTKGHPQEREWHAELTEVLQ